MRHFLGLLTAFALSTVTPALCAVTGSWTLAPANTTNQFRLEVSVQGPGYDDNSTSTLPRSALSLSDEQLQSSGEHVSFTVARDAGSFDCEGWIAHARGGGALTFVPDPTYLTKMRALGYGDITSDRQLTAAMLDISLAYAGGVAAAGYSHLGFDRLITFRALHVDEAYIRAMRQALGGGVIQPDQIVRLKAMRIDVAYIQKVEAHGIAHPTVDDLVRLKAMHII
jgi:hypothetical protein